MRRFVGTALFVATLGLPLILKQAAYEVSERQGMTENESSLRVDGETRTFVARPDVDLRTLSEQEAMVPWERDHDES